MAETHDKLDINGLTEKTVPVLADQLVLEDSADSNNRVKCLIDNLPRRNAIASATIDTATGSTTYVLMAGMTLTPAAGTYLATFSSSGTVNNGGADVQYAIHTAGVIVAHSERDFIFEGGNQFPGNNQGWHTQALVTVNGAQTVEVHWLTSAGTLTGHERSLILVKVGP